MRDMDGYYVRGKVYDKYTVRIELNKKKELPVEVVKKLNQLGKYYNLERGD